MSIEIAALLVLVLLTGSAVVLTRTPLRQVLAMSGNGTALALLFMVLQAPDVAMAELAVGAVATPLLFLVILANTKVQRSEEQDEDGEEGQEKEGAQG